MTLDKLFKVSKQWAKDEGYDKILTYADRRFGEGDVYLKAGFERIGEPSPDYWYTDGKIREGRFKYRAQDGLSEKEFTRAKKVKAIYGCGSNRYSLKL